MLCLEVFEIPSARQNLNCAEEKECAMCYFDKMIPCMRGRELAAEAKKNHELNVSRLVTTHFHINTAE